MTPLHLLIPLLYYYAEHSFFNAALSATIIIIIFFYIPLLTTTIIIARSARPSIPGLDVPDLQTQYHSQKDSPRCRFNKIATEMSRNTARTPLLSGPGDRMLPEISEASGEGGATNSLEEGKVDVEGSELSMHDNTSASEPTKNKLGTLWSLEFDLG